MSFENIHLRKLLSILFLDTKKRASALGKIAREEVTRETVPPSPGGNFHVGFWHDAKAHVLDGVDLHISTERRILADKNKRRLYPILRDGFLLWWDSKRRWTNEPFYPGQSVKDVFAFDRVNAEIKIDNILSVRDSRGVERYVYPYFSEEPALSDEAARVGLWVLTKALDNLPADSVRILDVIRGQTFSIDRYPMLGNEEENLLKRYSIAISERNYLKAKYRKKTKK